jgi:16S rRNA (uracil1498-N3)-methyltransferase
MVRLLVPLPSPAPKRLTLSGERFHYVAHVLRLEAGDALEVFDGQGRAFQATVARVDEAHAELALGAEVGRRLAPPLTLVQGLPKGDKLEWVLQKGTELGATAFAPAATARSVVKLEPRRAEERVRRWTRIVEEAARQCGRADVPQVHPPRPLLEAVAALAPGTRVLVLDEEERALSLGQAMAAGNGGPVAVVVGPEGGLERAEVAALVERGGIPVSLGPRLLRTETAALAALALIQHLRGELG